MFKNYLIPWLKNIYNNKLKKQSILNNQKIIILLKANHKYQIIQKILDQMVFKEKMTSIIKIIMTKNSNLRKKSSRIQKKIRR